MHYYEFGLCITVLIILSWCLEASASPVTHCIVHTWPTSLCLNHSFIKNRIDRCSLYRCPHGFCRLLAPLCGKLLSRRVEGDLVILSWGQAGQHNKATDWAMPGLTWCVSVVSPTGFVLWTSETTVYSPRTGSNILPRRRYSRWSQTCSRRLIVARLHTLYARQSHGGQIFMGNTLLVSVFN